MSNARDSIWLNYNIIIYQGCYRLNGKAQSIVVCALRKDWWDMKNPGSCPCPTEPNSNSNPEPVGINSARRLLFLRSAENRWLLLLQGAQSIAVAQQTFENLRIRKKRFLSLRWAIVLKLSNRGTQETPERKMFKVATTAHSACNFDWEEVYPVWESFHILFLCHLGESDLGLCLM